VKIRLSTEKLKFVFIKIKTDFEKMVSWNFEFEDMTGWLYCL